MHWDKNCVRGRCVDKFRSDKVITRLCTVHSAILTILISVMFEKIKKSIGQCPSFGGAQVSSPRLLIDRSYLRRSVISNQSRHFKETLENDPDAKNLQNKKIFQQIMQH